MLLGKEGDSAKWKDRPFLLTKWEYTIKRTCLLEKCKLLDKVFAEGLLKIQENFSPGSCVLPYEVVISTEVLQSNSQS